MKVFIEKSLVVIMTVILYFVLGINFVRILVMIPAFLSVVLNFESFWNARLIHLIIALFIPSFGALVTYRFLDKFGYKKGRKVLFGFISPEEAKKITKNTLILLGVLVTLAAGWSFLQQG